MYATMRGKASSTKRGGRARVFADRNGNAGTTTTRVRPVDKHVSVEIDESAFLPTPSPPNEQVPIASVPQVVRDVDNMLHTGNFRHDSFADDLADSYFDHLWSQRKKVTKQRSRYLPAPTHTLVRRSSLSRRSTHMSGLLSRKTTSANLQKLLVTGAWDDLLSEGDKVRRALQHWHLEKRSCLRRIPSRKLIEDIENGLERRGSGASSRSRANMSLKLKAVLDKIDSREKMATSVKPVKTADLQKTDTKQSFGLRSNPDAGGKRRTMSQRTASSQSLSSSDLHYEAEESDRASVDVVEPVATDGAELPTICWKCKLADDKTANLQFHGKHTCVLADEESKEDTSTPLSMDASAVDKDLLNADTGRMGNDSMCAMGSDVQSLHSEATEGEATNESTTGDKPAKKAKPWVLLNGGTPHSRYQLQGKQALTQMLRRGGNTSSASGEATESDAVAADHKRMKIRRCQTESNNLNHIKHKPLMSVCSSNALMTGGARKEQTEPLSRVQSACSTVRRRSSAGLLQVSVTASLGSDEEITVKETIIKADDKVEEGDVVEEIASEGEAFSSISNQHQITFKELEEDGDITVVGFVDENAENTNGADPEADENQNVPIVGVSELEAGVTVTEQVDIKLNIAATDDVTDPQLPDSTIDDTQTQENITVQTETMEVLSDNDVMEALSVNVSENEEEEIHKESDQVEEVAQSVTAEEPAVDDTPSTEPAVEDAPSTEPAVEDTPSKETEKLAEVVNEMQKAVEGKDKKSSKKSSSKTEKPKPKWPSTKPKPPPSPPAAAGVCDIIEAHNCDICGTSL